MNIQAWIISTGTVVCLGLIGFLGKEIIGILKDIRTEIKALIIATTTHQTEIAKLKEANKDHENRLRYLEGVPPETI